MRVLLFCLLLLIWAPKPFWGAEGYIDVTAPTGRKLQLAVAPVTALSGPAALDLALPGAFEVAAVEAGTAGADLVLKCAYAVNGSALTLECRLIDPVLNRELAAKRYTGGLKELRRMGHAFADEV